MGQPTLTKANAEILNSWPTIILSAFLNFSILQEAQLCFSNKGYSKPSSDLANSDEQLIVNKSDFGSVIDFSQQLLMGLGNSNDEAKHVITIKA